MVKRKLSIRGNNIEEFIKLIKNEFAERTSKPSENVVIFYCEQYYMRIKSQLMTAIVICMKENICEIEVVTGGGGAGMFSIDWGAEESRTDSIIETIQHLASKIDYIVEEV